MSEDLYDLGWGEEEAETDTGHAYDQIPDKSNAALYAKIAAVAVLVFMLILVIAAGNRERKADEAWRDEVSTSLATLDSRVDLAYKSIMSLETTASQTASQTAAVAARLGAIETALEALKLEVYSKEPTPAPKPAPTQSKAQTEQPARQPQTAVEAFGAWKTSKASWYGPGLYGGKTADGTPFTTTTWCVAHRTLKMGTMLEIEYRGKTVKVPVKDRGPHVAGRELDLSGAVASALGFTGVDDVRWRIAGK